MKSKLDRVIETLESIIVLHNSINDFFREFKQFADALFHAQIQAIENDFHNLKKYHYDSKFACEDKLSTALPIQMRKEEIEAVLDEQEDAFIYN